MTPSKSALGTLGQALTIVALPFMIFSALSFAPLIPYIATNDALRGILFMLLAILIGIALLAGWTSFSTIGRFSNLQPALRAVFLIEIVTWLHFCVLPTGKFETVRFLRRTTECKDCQFVIAGVDPEKLNPFADGVVANFGKGCESETASGGLRRVFYFPSQGVYLETIETAGTKRIRLSSDSIAEKNCLASRDLPSLWTTKGITLGAPEATVLKAYGMPSSRMKNERGRETLIYEKWLGDPLRGISSSLSFEFSENSIRSIAVWVPKD